MIIFYFFFKVSNDNNVCKTKCIARRIKCWRSVNRGLCKNTLDHCECVVQIWKVNKLNMNNRKQQEKPKSQRPTNWGRTAPLLFKNNQTRPWSVGWAGAIWHLICYDYGNFAGTVRNGIEGQMRCRRHYWKSGRKQEIFAQLNQKR